MNEAEATSVPVPDPYVWGTGNSSLYADVATLLREGVPPMPVPDIMRRTDGVGLFYRQSVNNVYGRPESAKTFLGLAGGKQVLDDGGRFAVIDLDHNGASGTVGKLQTIGASESDLGDLGRFRYAEPLDSTALRETVADLAQWGADMVLVDSMGELLPVLGLSSNSPDDFTVANRMVLSPLAHSGAAVVVIDHVSKHGADLGPTGTVAKHRAVNGVMLQVEVKEPFAPGRGGSSYISVYKDRPGGLRANSPGSGKEPLAGTFVMHQDGHCEVYAASEDERKPVSVPAPDLDALMRLDPPPDSVRDVKDRLHWRTDRAANALRVYRSQDMGGDSVPRSPDTPPGNGNSENVPDPELFPGNGNEAGDAA